MPFSTEFTARGVIHTGSGLVTGAELRAGAQETHASPACPALLEYGVVDFTEATELRVTYPELRLVAAESQITASRVAPAALVALVAPTSVVSGIVRIWQILTETTGWRCAVFATRAEAEQWIASNLAPPAAP